MLLGVIEAIHDNVSVSRLVLGSDFQDFEPEVQQRHLCHPLCEWPICEDNQLASMAIANVVWEASEKLEYERQTPTVLGDACSRVIAREVETGAIHI